MPACAGMTWKFDVSRVARVERKRNPEVFSQRYPVSFGACIQSLSRPFMNRTGSAASSASVTRGGGGGGGGEGGHATLIET